MNVEHKLNTKEQTSTIKYSNSTVTYSAYTVLYYFSFIGRKDTHWVRIIIFLLQLQLIIDSKILMDSHTFTWLWLLLCADTQQCPEIL